MHSARQSAGGRVRELLGSTHESCALGRLDRGEEISSDSGDLTQEIHQRDLGCLFSVHSPDREAGEEVVSSVYP